jgi:hypothetical protein
MTYVFAFIAVAIAVPLLIFVGIWGGLIWIVVAAIAVVLLLLRSAREVPAGRTEPTGVERASRGDAQTANERVEQR